MSTDKDELAEAILAREERQEDMRRKALLTQICLAVYNANLPGNRRKIWPAWTLVNELVAEWIGLKGGTAV